MSVSIQIKSFIAKIFQYSGLAEYIIYKCSSNKFLILMYHRIIPNKEAKPGLQAGMYVEPHTFEIHIKYLKENFQIIPLSESMNNFGKFSSLKSKPICILTFDDGWFDFYQYAYPLLKAHGVPATVFLPTKFIGTKNQFWTDALAQLCTRRGQEERVFRKKSSSSLPVIDLLESSSIPLEISLERAIERMKSLPQEEINRILVDLSERWGIDTDLRERDFLTWDEVREMHRSGLVSFGSHTETHKILTTLRDDEIAWELRQSKERLLAEGVVDPSCLPFAYPNGNYNDRIVELVKKHGYHLAVTTKNGWVRHSDGMRLFELERIGIHQDMASTGAMFGCRILNII
jgi:peptidoglycan/xylan/chitin deacetylase (PgdA/CDA1 family)